MDITPSAPLVARMASVMPRPRISLLTALLLMTIVGMTVVIVQLWREVAPLRLEVQQLRKETGRLDVPDKSQLCAMQVDTNDDLLWKWRIWVPENHAYTLNVTAEKIPDQGFPQSHGTMLVNEPGEYVVEFRIQRDQASGSCYGTLHYSFGRIGNYETPWIDWGTRTSEVEEVGRQTGMAQPGEPFVLIRERVAKAADSTEIDELADGLMIWLEPTK